MTVGTITDVINATQVLLYLDPSGANQRYVVMQEISMPLVRPETREEVELGSVYMYGKHDNSFEGTFFLTSLDIVEYLNNNAFDSNNVLKEQTYQLEFQPKTGSSVKVNVKAVTPHQVIDKLPAGGVKIRQLFRIVEDVTGNNVV